MRPARRPYLDWLRGFAVLCMIAWHVMDSWTMPGAKTGSVWPIIQTIGGFAAPLFLFLAGVAVPFAIASHVSRGVSLREASWRVQKRGWQVFLIAHALRLQSFLTNPNAVWSSLLKPDVLNILGIGLAGTAWLAGRSDRRRGWLWLLVAAAIVLILTPWSRIWWWPTLLHPRLAAYIRPNGYGVFALFPWLAFVPVGAFIGSLLVAPRDEAGERRFHWQLLAAGLTLVAVEFVVSLFKIPDSTWWAIEPWPRFLMQIGYMTAGIWLTWLLMRIKTFEATSGPMILFGQTSLFVYLVHLELAFGVLSYPLHGALSIPGSAVGFLSVTVLMYFAARWWKNRPGGALIPVELRADSR